MTSVIRTAAGGLSLCLPSNAAAARLDGTQTGGDYRAIDGTGPQPWPPRTVQYRENGLIGSLIVRRLSCTSTAEAPSAKLGHAVPANGSNLIDKAQRRKVMWCAQKDCKQDENRYFFPLFSRYSLTFLPPFRVVALKGQHERCQNGESVFSVPPLFDSVHTPIKACDWYELRR